MTRFRGTSLHSPVGLTIPLLERQEVLSSTLIHQALDSLVKLLCFPFKPSGPEMWNITTLQLAAISAGNSVDMHGSGPIPPLPKRFWKSAGLSDCSTLCSQTQVTLSLGQWWTLRSRGCLAPPYGEISSVIDVHRERGGRLAIN